MTWEELENLPAQVAEQIERCARGDMASSERCRRVNLETNVFFGNTGKSDFVTPDFLVHRCLPPFADVHASDTALVGEVLSPSNTQTDMEAKRARYAAGGIPWYWETALHRTTGAIGTVRVYGLDIGHAELPQGVRPLRPGHLLSLSLPHRGPLVIAVILIRSECGPARVVQSPDRAADPFRQTIA